ncbi:MAG: NADH-quinone oxidoreductase subunit J [Bacteroidales bacterium]|nr:NADH-quinone oxidoreductase subunit J [Bacteroidales bacterium]
METALFYILAGLIVTFAAMTVFSRQIFRSAIYLLTTLTFIAGIYMMMEMAFMAALQIIIYVGGIVVLIIFSVFLTHKSGENIPGQPLGRHIRSGVLAALGLVLVLGVLIDYSFTPSMQAPIEATVQNVGRQMLSYTDYGYVFPFEIVSLFLLSALVGSIVIAMRSKEEKK